MKKKIGVLAGVLVAVIAFAVVYKLYGNLSQGYDMMSTTARTQDYVLDDGVIQAETTQRQADLAPDFTVYDMDGNAINLSDYKGKPVVINFWTSWCGYCVYEMPLFEEAHKNNPDVQFLMVNATVDDNRQQAEALIAESGYTFPVVYDTEGNATEAYGINSFPVTYFIDEQGQVVTYSMGMLGEEGLQSRINMIKQ